MIRQGDVLLIPLQGLPRGRKKLDVKGIKISGERTGHSHTLEAEVYEGNIIHLHQDGIMTHEEHHPVAVPQGWYEVRLQREYVPAARPVLRRRVD